jgi:hypothetical protein
MARALRWGLYAIAQNEVSGSGRLGIAATPLGGPDRGNSLPRATLATMNSVDGQAGDAASPDTPKPSRQYRLGHSGAAIHRMLQ